ncbi:gamma-glutamylcyclotransferase family protein [Halonatronomonas betaini]
MKIYYFAYGSNMSSRRLKERIPSARSVTTARLNNYRFACNKIGGDNTGYANLEYDPESHVYGVVYKLQPDHFNTLDLYEGNYQRKEVRVEAGSKKLKAITYISDYTSNDLQVADWYQEYILNGAREHQLPAEYIQTIKEELNHKREANWRISNG